MATAYDQRQLKMRRPQPNPQEDDIESSSSFEDIKKPETQRQEALSPLSKRIVRFVSPDHNPYLEAVGRVLPPLAVLLLGPMLLWDIYDYSSVSLSPWRIVRSAHLAWSSLLHTSSWPIALLTVVIVALLPRGGIKYKSFSSGLASQALGLGANITQSSWKMSMVISFVLMHLVIFQMALQMGYPSLLWNPFLWGWYKVYLPQDIGSAMKGACFDDMAARKPLCLDEWQWDELSSGTLSSSNPDDVLAVQRGYQYLQNSGGLLINALARNVVDAIPALKQNMEGLAPLVKDDNLALVLFENDSDDGTREALKMWANEKNLGYTVDLMGCGPQNPDCQLNIEDRYDSNLFINPKASGVGKLGEFRQILLEYITSQPKYEDYSHMVVLDVDLGTSLSPLGLLHTLGLKGDIAEDYVVASASSQVWPG